MLALSFLLLIGLSLLLEGFDQHVPKGYIYFAMGFSVLVELLNIRARRRRETRSTPVRLHRRYSREEQRPRRRPAPRPRSVPGERILPAGRRAGCARHPIGARIGLLTHRDERVPG